MATKAGPRGAVTEMGFKASIVDVKPVIEKKAQYGATTPGELRVTLAIKQPQPPTPPREPVAPRIPWNLSVDQQEKEWIERPTADADGKKFDVAKKAFDTQKVKYDAEMEKHQAAVANFESGPLQRFRENLLQYTWLPGMAMVFGDKTMKVTLRPDDQDMLPGMGVALLAETAGE